MYLQQEGASRWLAFGSCIIASQEAVSSHRTTHSTLLIASFCSLPRAERSPLREGCKKSIQSSPNNVKVRYPHAGLEVRYPTTKPSLHTCIHPSYSREKASISSKVSSPLRKSSLYLTQFPESDKPTRVSSQNPRLKEKPVVYPSVARTRSIACK